MKVDTAVDKINEDRLRECSTRLATVILKKTPPICKLVIKSSVKCKTLFPFHIFIVHSVRR